MAKDPAFLFYPGDWQGGTITFTRFLKGCYMDILIAQFNSGHLSLEEIKTVLGSDFGQSWPTIQKKFKQDANGLFFNEKLETEMIKRKEYSKSRADNRRKKDMKKTCNTHDKTYVLHMENENENEVRDSIKKESAAKVPREAISKFEIFEGLFTDELYVEGLARTHKGKDLHQAFEECFIHHSQTPSPPQELWEWRQKLNTWLTIKKVERNGTSKKTDTVNSRREAFAKRHSSDAGG